MIRVLFQVGVLFAGFLVLIVGLSFLSPTVVEVSVKSIYYIMGLLCTPFMLESISFIFGLLLLLTYNQIKRQEEGDEWIKLEVPVDLLVDSREQVTRINNNTDLSNQDSIIN
jgi:hypothetical protein